MVQAIFQYLTELTPQIQAHKTEGLIVAGYNQLTSYVTIENFDLYNGIKQNFGLGIGTGNTANIIIQNSVIHTNRTGGYMLIYIANFGAQGSTNNIVIRDNHIYDSKWNGMRITGGVTNVTISGNQIHQVLHNGLDTYPTNSSNNKNFEIYNNNIYDFGGGNGAGIIFPAQVISTFMIMIFMMPHQVQTTPMV